MQVEITPAEQASVATECCGGDRELSAGEEFATAVDDCEGWPRARVVEHDAAEGAQKAAGVVDVTGAGDAQAVIGGEQAVAIVEPWRDELDGAALNAQAGAPRVVVQYCGGAELGVGGRRRD